MTSENRPATQGNSYIGLLRDRSFHSFLWTQFLGAFNDNVYKMIVSVGAVEFAANRLLGARYLAVAGAVFVLPFLLFAGYAGQIADRYSKTRVLQVTKAFEIVIMFAGMAALKARSIDLLLVVLFLLAMQANFFSPAKYGILPEMLNDAALSRANGLLEFSTFAAIILGTSGGSFLFARWKDQPLAMGGALLAFAVAGSVSSLFIRRTAPSGTKASFTANPFGEIREGTRRIRKERSLWLTVAGISWFWFIGALFQLAVILLGKETLRLSETHIGLLVTALAVGIGIGSVAAGWLSGDRVELGLVPCGGALLGVCSICLGLAHSFGTCVFWLDAAGFAGGLFVVPLNAFLQEAAGPQEKGRLLATNSFWNSIGIVGASGLLWVLHDLLHWTASEIFIALGAVTVCSTVVIARVVPGPLVRLAVWCLTKVFFRVRLVGMQNIPATGSALIVANHVSYADAILIGCACSRPVRFLMFQQLYENRWLRPVCRLFETIPVPQGSANGAMRALRQARGELAKGQIVCIFPEGKLTRSGQVEPFERGVEVIERGAENAPVIPVYLDGLWGHPASLKGGRAFVSWPRLRHSVTIVIGAPMAAGSSAVEMRQRILELGPAAAEQRVEASTTLAHRFIRQARRNWNSDAIVDSTRTMTYGETLAAALYIRDRISGLDPVSTNIGLLFPASVGGAIANIGVTLSGKTAVNLNFTAGEDHMRQAVEVCGIRTVLSSRRFLETAKLPEIPGMVCIEDLFADFTSARKALCGLRARFVPTKLLTGHIGPDDVAAVVFSSGSTGIPKGVMLSHWNLIANTGATADIFGGQPGDCLLGALPFFHSFGYTYTIWFPLLNGFRAVYHPNPLDARAIGEMAARFRPVFFLSTPTFCLGYLRRCTREQFASIRCLLVGAEKLRPALAEAFQEKFGITLLEGYGCTEMGPVVSVNTCEAHKAGSAGRPLPDVSIRIVDPDTLAAVEAGQTGLLLVNGPSRMQGYFGDVARTCEALHEGYYVTGDLACVDADGFLHIVDRMARFSKIAGEMVPHGKIEDALASVAGAGTCAVTGIPDDRRGERLVVVYANAAVTPAEMISELEAMGVPALWIPKRDCFCRVETIPVLGSGKVDLKAVRAIAGSMTNACLAEGAVA